MQNEMYVFISIYNNNNNNNKETIFLFYFEKSTFRFSFFPNDFGYFYIFVLAFFFG
jgi:hypothetical protein